MAKSPIPLRDSEGTIRAWACPRCYRVSMSTSCGGPNGRIEEAKYSRERALDCGICRDCGAETDCNEFKMLCVGCQRKQQVRSDAFIAQHQAEWAEQREAKRITRELELSKLLADLGALRARDWVDDEDLAVELMPLLLERLDALQAQGAVSNADFAVDPAAQTRQEGPTRDKSSDSDPTYQEALHRPKDKGKML